jgi:hypothetical protein
MQSLLASMQNSRSSKILFLRGVYSHDCRTTDDIFFDKMMEKMEDRETRDEPIIYDKLPIEFTSLESWPKKTNLKCWSCDLTFIGPPVFIPQNIHNSSMVCNGNFCSFFCAMRYINVNYSGVDAWQYKCLLYQLYHKFNGVHVIEIPEAPPKTLMVQYGGIITHADYVVQLNKLKDNIILYADQ